MPNKRGYKKRGSALKTSPPTTSPRRTKTPTPTQTLTPVRRVGRPPSKLRSPASPIQRSSLPTVSPKPGEKLQQSCNHTQQLWSDVSCGTATAEATKPRQMHDSPEHSTSLHDSSDQEINIQDHIYRPQSQHSVSEDDAIHANPTPTAAMPPDSHPQEDANNSQNRPKKLSKREVKALLKQPKRARTILDESVVAEMDQLATRFEVDCKINVAGVIRRPIPVAEPIDSNTSLLSTPPVPVSPPAPAVVRGGRGRGRGRRGSATAAASLRRGGAKAGSFASLTPAPTRTPRTASWSPLCLPARASYEGPQHKSPAPRLKFLSASCVKNFLARVESILSRSHSQQSRLLPTHSLDANGFDFSHKQEPAPLTTYPSLPPTAPAAEQSYYQHQQLKPVYHHHHHHHHHHNEMPEEQHHMRKAEAYPSNYAPHSPPPSQPPPSTAPVVVPGPPDSLQVGETSSAVSIVRHVRPGRPPKRGGQRRGRGRPRILNLSSDDALRAAVAEAGAESERAKWHQYEGVDQPRSYHPAGDSAELRASPQKPPSPATEAIPTGGPSGTPGCLTMQQLVKPGKPGRPRGSISARRELRGLVTWAAMMAAEEQAAQQKQHRRHSLEDADSSLDAEPARKPTGLSPLSLQIVGMEDDLTGTADGSGLSDPSRTTRRTRRASLGTASGGSSVGATTATRGGHVSGRRASETGSSVSVVDAGDQSLKDGLQPNASSWASDQADTSSLLPFSPSPLHVAASDATMDSTVPERQQNNSSSNGEVGLPTNASEEDQVQPPVRSLHRGRGGGGGGRGRKRKYQRGIGRPSEQTIPPSPPPPPTPQSDQSMPTAFPPFAAGNGASSDDNNDDKCVSGSPHKSTAADEEDSSSSGARRLDPAASGGGSGGPILPPRKRYKANVDSADEQRPSTSPQPTSRPPLSPSIDGGDLSSPSPPSNPAHSNLSDLSCGYLAPVGSAGVRSSLESDSPLGVRGGTRGRGGLRGRRKGRGGRRSLHQPFETHQDTKAAADNATTSVVDTTPSRPKREAAALGFASLVASSLNSSPIQYDQSESSIKPSQQTPVDPHHQNSPSLTTSETVDPATTPTTPVGTTLASVRTPSQKSWRGGGTPPVGRGRGLRGRPPKRPIAATPTVLFPPPLLTATASAAATAAADGTLQAKMDSSFSSETSATTATSINDSPPAQSATTPTAATGVTDAPVSAPSEAELLGAGLLPAPPVSTEASVVTGEGLPVLTGKRKIGGGGKRGRRPTTTQVSSPPTKRRAVEDTAPPPPSSVNGSSATAPTTRTPPPPPASSTSGFGTDELNHACRDLRLFLLRTHARSEHRLRRDRERRSKASELTANVDGTVGSTKRLLTGTVERLPSRNLIFPFGSLARKLLEESEEKAGLRADLVPTDGVQALLATLLHRLLNHTDLEPNGAGARLVAPLLSTPDPLRHPDFYRYACSTGALTSLETALGLPKLTGHSLQADILLTVSPCYCFTNGYAGQRSVPAPFQHLSPEYPPICLRSLLHSVLNGKLLLTSDAESSLSATTATAFQRLDLAFDLLMRLWEAYAGRRSWLGRRLLQIRGAYTRLRTEQTAEDSSIPLPHLTPGSASAANKIQGASPGSGPLKKKVDRRTLERGAEVIRCLCGFRVEAGHVMVQCDCCTTWQHLPCVWWALSIYLEPSLAAPRSTPSSQLANWLPHQPPHDPDFGPEEGADTAAADSAARRARCRAALLAALLTGGISLPAHSGGGNCGSAGSTTAAPDCAYFCPTCLELDGLTKDYPRTLAVALAQNDVAKVFPETEPGSTAGVTYEYWSLASPDGGDQLLTDEFALVHRDDFHYAVERGSAVAATVAGTTTETGQQTNELRLASDVVVLRIYRLWKDSSGKSWMEGGAFLRPYDLLKGAPPQTTALVNSQLWHARELVYDEASRVVLPLSAWRGRCSVLSPTVYRQGRLMDLPALILPSSTAEVEETDAHPLVFLCDRLFNRGEGDSLSFQEIAPAYLKVNMKPYAFLRHTESSALRAAIVRQLRAEDLRTLDSSTAFGAVLSVNLDGLYSQSRERRQKGRQDLLSPRRTHELVFSLSEKVTLDAALGRLSSQSRKQHATTTDSRIFTHTNRKSCLPAKLGDSTISHPNLPAGDSEALSSSAGPTSELSSTSALLLMEGTELTTPAAIHVTADPAVIPSTKRSGKSKAGSGKIRDQDLLKDAKTLTFSELREKIAAQEGLSAKTTAPPPRRKVVSKQHTVSSTSTVKSSLKHTSAAAAAAAAAAPPTDSTQPDLGPPRSPLFVETTTPTGNTDLAKKPQFSPISPATSPLSPDPTSSAIAIVADTVQQQQKLSKNYKSPPPSSQLSKDLHSTAPSTFVESTLPGAPRLLSSSELIEPDKPTEETVSEFSDVELSSKAATGSTVIATAMETACHNTACSAVMLATPSRLKPIPLKVNQALVMVSSSEEENFETCDELLPIPGPHLVAIQEEENDDFAGDGDVQSSCLHLSAGVTVSTTESVSLATCAPVISHRAEASCIPCVVKTLESSPQLETLEGLDATEVNEEFAQWTVCSPAGAYSRINPFSTVCEMVLSSPFSTTVVAPMSLSDIPSPAEATSTVVTSLSDFIAESADAIVYTCPQASLVAPGCRVSPPNGQQSQPLRSLISPAFTYQPISPDSSDESPCRTHASVQPPQSEISNAVGDDSVQLDGNRLSTAATDEEKRQRHSVSRSSPSGVWSPAQSRDHRDRRRHSHHRYHHHHRDRDHRRRSSSNRSRSNSEHQQPPDHHQHRHYHHRQHRHSDCSSVESEQRERQRSRSQSDHRHSRHERYPEAKDATASVAAAENTSRPNSHHRRRKGHSPKRIVFRRYEDGTSATATRDSGVTAPVSQEGVLDLSTSSSSTLAPESNGGEVSSGGSSNN
ncbi:hypothetical protein SprV_0902773100 [Sparganum proliferum]